MEDHEYGLHRLHSLLGVIPIGLFLIVHLTVNYQATKGAGAFNQAANVMESLPYLLFLEIIMIYLPILFHAVFGVYIAFTAKNNVGNFSFFRNWMFLLQRFSGLFLVIFLAWHLWQTRIAMALGTPLNYELMVHALSNPGTVIFYLVGIVCAVYHFSNGLWAFCVHWGFLASPKSQRIGSYVSLAIFILLSYVGIRALFAFI
jgi:succinate dehydrogenase (or fumarate reductase) cytochrome b subunit, b558 family